MTPTQKPLDSLFASRLSQPPPACLTAITKLPNQTTGRILVHIAPGPNPIVCHDVPQYQSTWHHTLWKRELPLLAVFIIGSFGRSTWHVTQSK